MTEFVRNGWTIRFHRLFADQYYSLLRNVKDLKKRLKPSSFQSHPDAKHLAALLRALNDLIPSDPKHHRFSLRPPLQRFSRLKGAGLPSRNRLFFKVDVPRKTIVFLWLGYPRKQGDRRDCYTVFAKMVKSGAIPENLDALLEECD